MCELLAQLVSHRFIPVELCGHSPLGLVERKSDSVKSFGKDVVDSCLCTVRQEDLKSKKSLAMECGHPDNLSFIKRFRKPGPVLIKLL